MKRSTRLCHQVEWMVSSNEPQSRTHVVVAVGPTVAPPSFAVKSTELPFWVENSRSVKVHPVGTLTVSVLMTRLVVIRA